MRPALAEAARPEPGVVGEEERDAALLLAREHQERLVVRAGHHRGAGAHLRADEAQPLAPGGRRLLGARQLARHRMALGRRW